jgi:hypothetical protein
MLTILDKNPLFKLFCFLNTISLLMFEMSLMRGFSISFDRFGWKE